jgi:hypothetical protein
MNRLEIYGIGIVILVLAFVGAYFKGRHEGFKEDEAKHAAALLQANEKVDALQDKLDQAKEEQAHALVELNTKHAQELVAAAASIKPVIVRVPADTPDQAHTPGSPASGIASASDGQSDILRTVEVDIAPKLLLLAGECQRDRDARFAWQALYERQMKLIDNQ